MNFSKQTLVKNFIKVCHQPQVSAHGAKTAAVLVPLTLIDQQWHLLFIRRAQVPGDVHSGQVAFPGGLAELRDVNAEATALREAQEEVGLLSEHVQIIGDLAVFRSITDIPVSPVVGLLPWPYQFSLQAAEVSRVFTIPLAWLNDESNYQIKQRYVPVRSVPADVIYYNEYDGEVLWGLTARIVRSLLDKLLRL